MKMKLPLILLLGFMLIGCKSEVDKCVDSHVLASKHEFSNENELNKFKARARVGCMRAAAGQ